jgi:4-amino-4-deoxy-L-arabinose transferase
MSDAAFSGLDRRAASGPSVAARASAPAAARRVASAFLLVLLWGAAAGVGLGSYPLIDPDEGRNAGAALSLLDGTGGEWLLPRYAGLPYLDKPPLWFGAAALTMRALGVAPAAARLPSLLAFAAAALVVAWFARRLFDRPEVALVAAVAFASSPLVLAYARIAILDPLLTLFVLVSLVAGHQAVESDRSSAWATIGWIAVLLGLLTKGPVALLWPLLVCLPYAAWRGRLRRLWSAAGALAVVVVVVSWLTLVEARVPGFVRYALITETWDRLTTDTFERSAPVWSYLPVLAFGVLPWGPAALAAWTARRGRWRTSPDPRQVFLGLWLVVPLVFFSLSMSKRPHYLLPLLPAVALLLAPSWDDPVAGPRARLAAGSSLALLGGVVAGLALDPPALARTLATDLDGLVVPTLAVLAAVWLVAGLTAIACRRRPGAGLAVLAGAVLATPAILLPAVRVVAEHRSAAGIAGLIEARCPGRPILGVEELPASLPFYAASPVGLASADGRGFPSEYVRRHWEELTSDGAALPPRSVLVFRRGDQVLPHRAAAGGFTLLGESGDLAAWARGCVPAP